MKKSGRDLGSSAWNALLHAHGALVEGVEADLLAETGLPLSWHEVLSRLEGGPEHGLRMQELARSVLLSRSGLTRLADRMQEAGLVERRACDLDRRGTYVAMTATGREALRRSSPVFLRSVERRLVAHLSASEMEGLIRRLNTVARANADRPGSAREPAAASRAPA